MRALPLLLLLLTACGAPEATRTYTSGDTTYVATGGPPTVLTLEEELVIGQLDGPEEYMLGQVSEMAFDEQGGVYIFEAQPPAIRYYDGEGTYVRTLGAVGSGPGEYQDVILGMHVRGDGRLMIRDPRNARLTLYNPDGTFSENWPVASGLFTSQALFVDENDVAYLKIMTAVPERNRPWEIDLLRVLADGTLADTLKAPTIEGEPEESDGTYGTSKIWTLSATGAMVVGLNNTYSFHLRHPDGKVTVVSRDPERVRFLPEERRAIEERNEWRRTYYGDNMTTEIPPVPDHKPFYRSMESDRDGRIWVRVYTEALEDPDFEPRPVDERTPPGSPFYELPTYDVFSPVGEYVGRVVFTRGASLDHASGNIVWGYRTGDSGQPQVVRYRLGEGV